MHPELSKELVYRQLDEAITTPGLFGEFVQLEQVGYPELFIRYRTVEGSLRLLRFECTNYDFQALDVDAVHPTTRAALQADEWVRRDNGMNAFPIHPDWGGPFFCIQGVRRFYTYPGHDPATTGEPWEKHRPEFHISAIISAFAQRFSSGQWR